LTKKISKSTYQVSFTDLKIDEKQRNLLFRSLVTLSMVQLRVLAQ